jgi:hypothetical protein
MPPAGECIQYSRSPLATMRIVINPKGDETMQEWLQVQELEERIAPSGVGNPHDAPPGQGNWGGGPGNSGNGDQNGNNEQGGGGQPKDKP